MARRPRYPGASAQPSARDPRCLGRL